MEGTLKLIINSQDALVRRIHEGQLVKIFNARGTFQASAHLSDEVQAGIVVSPFGQWRQLSPVLNTLSAVVSTAYSDLGKAGSVSDTWVEVQLVDS